MRWLLSLLMGKHSSATHGRRPLLPAGAAAGCGWGFLGILAFSFTVPFTSLAVGGLSPLFIGSGRAVVAAVLAAVALGATRQSLPSRRVWGRLAVVAGGVVVGFPLLTSYALTTVPASHAAAVIALLPATTAAMAVVRARERPPMAFWVIGGAGATLTMVVASTHSGGLGDVGWADLLLLGAVLSAGIGYAEGGLLARELGAWQTMSWALVLSAPLMAALTLYAVAQQAVSASPVEWLSFAYLAVVSMFLAFFAWYRGLAIGPMAQVSQVQLLQPVLSISWAVLLLGEQITLVTVLGGVGVIACASAVMRVRLGYLF